MSPNPGEAKAETAWPQPGGNSSAAGEGGFPTDSLEIPGPQGGLPGQWYRRVSSRRSSPSPPPPTPSLPTAQIYNRQGSAGDPRLKGGGTAARSSERATVTRPRALLGDQRAGPGEADGDPRVHGPRLRGDAASRSPSRAPPYLAGFVELLLEPRHRHRGGAPPGGGLGAPPGHAAATLSGAGTPGGPRAPHGHGHGHGAVTLARARAQTATPCFEAPAQPIGRAAATCK